jgi:lysophospholipid acyltransferase (LPLAT)-like uncharacterized protein
MFLVFWTSRVEKIGLERFFVGADSGGVSLGAVWHQDILTAGFLYRGRKVVAMASRSADGEIAARILRRCGYIAVRGSSSRGGKEGLREMLDYLRKHRGAIAGLSVDGPRGPAFRSKIGMVVLAREMGVPLFPLRTWARRRVAFRSWDRTMLPLPFNHIVAWAGEPLVVPAGTDDMDLEPYRAELDRRLNHLVHISLERFP